MLPDIDAPKQFPRQIARGRSAEEISGRQSDHTRYPENHRRTPYRREQSAVRLSHRVPFRHRHFRQTDKQYRQTIMPAIQAIVETYVRLRNEDALLASKQQRLRVLAMCDAGNPMFERLRSQCLEEIAEIEAGLERLRPAPLPPDPPPNLPQAEGAHDPVPAMPEPVPNLPQVEEARSPTPPDLLLSLPQVQVEEAYVVAKLLLDPPPYLPQVKEIRGPAPASPDLPPKPPQVTAASDSVPSLPAASPTPINPSPFLAVEALRPAVASAPSSIPAASDFPARSAPADPPQFVAAVSPSFLASTILAASISSRLSASEPKPAELMRLQIALEKRMKPQG